MGNYEKLLCRILRGLSDANIDFDDRRGLLLDIGFEMRTKDSHHVFRKNGVPEKINLQRDGSKAKSYQVRQARNIIQRYQLARDM